MNSLLVLVVVLYLASSCFSLKCQTDDGITEEDVRRIVRVCMRKVGENTYDGSEYSDTDSEEYDDQENNERNDRKYSRGGGGEDQRNRDHYRNFRQTYRNGDYGGGDYDGYTRGGDRSRNQNVSLTDKQAEKDRACIVHCFFQEMKMTNDRQLPDKHKVIQVITKDLRDKQLKEFYINSIQECFYVLELDHQRPEKCQFSTRLLQCLAERARSNCDDWDNRTIIF